VAPSARARRILDQIDRLAEIGAGKGEEHGALAGVEVVELFADAELVEHAVELHAHGGVAGDSELGETEVCRHRGQRLGARQEPVRQPHQLVEGHAQTLIATGRDDSA